MKSAVLTLLHSEASMAQVDRMTQSGMISQRLHDAFEAVWNWSAPRMGGSIGLKHDAFWNKYGQCAYYRRINKVRNAFGYPRLTGT